MRRDVFQAIADPTRRQIVTMVAKESLNLNAVARQFNVSRPAISKHIKILAECGLITIHQKGRERFCEAKVEKLTEVSDWLVQFREMWEAKFDSLDNYLAEIQETTKAKEISEEKATASQVGTVLAEEAASEPKAPSPKMPEFLAPRKKPAAKVASAEEKADAPKAKKKSKSKKAKKAKKTKTPLLVGKVTNPEPEKKKVTKTKEPEKPAPEMAPNQYSLF